MAGIDPKVGDIISFKELPGEELPGVSRYIHLKGLWIIQAVQRQGGNIYDFRLSIAEWDTDEQTWKQDYSHWFVRGDEVEIITSIDEVEDALRYL